MLWSGCRGVLVHGIAPRTEVCMTARSGSNGHGAYRKCHTMDASMPMDILSAVPGGAHICPLPALLPLFSAHRS